MRFIGTAARHVAAALTALLLGAAGSGPIAARADDILSLVPPPGVPKLNVQNSSGHGAHIMPLPSVAAQMRAAAPPPSTLSYHGGPIMKPDVQIYAIYWQPAGAVMVGNYKSVLNNMLKNYAGHAIANINTQYYQTVGAVTTYSSGLGKLAGTYTDTTAYPASGCPLYSVSGVPITKCFTDAQIQAEVTHVMGISAAGKPVWTRGINKIFVLFTAKGIGSCFDSGGSSCAYTAYCAYHSFFGTTSSPTIYSNEPYGEPSHCNTVAAASLPNGGGGYADTAATAARHEVSEASTDPFLNAWYDSSTGEENSDKCAYQYGTNTWDAGKANYKWAATFLELQMEWSNHANFDTGGCVQQGP